MKYCKKPVVIDAIHFISKDDAKELCDFVGNNLSYNIISDEYYINTLEGIHHISEGDYIIKGVHGEFYPCKPDIFEETYELVEEVQA